LEYGWNTVGISLEISNDIPTVFLKSQHIFTKNTTLDERGLEHQYPQRASARPPAACLAKGRWVPPGKAGRKGMLF
jgi:hypothetical protein